MFLLLSAPILAGLSRDAWAADEAHEDITVWGDLFARWDDTRWYVSTELALPFEIVLGKDENLAFNTDEFTLSMVYACNKDAKLSKQRLEVECVIEDFGMRAAIDDWTMTAQRIENAQLVLNEIDAKLTGATMSLHVADDGRVTNIGLDGVAADNRRQSIIHETLRQLLMRTIAGFHLKMQRFNQLEEGKWLEQNSPIMNLPERTGAVVAGVIGSNRIVHQLSHYKGNVIVQSVGEGVTVLEERYQFTTDYSGVAVFDDVNGFMVERVWTLNAASAPSAGINTLFYFQAGRLTMLGTADKPDVGATEVVNGRNQTSKLLPAWTPPS